MDRTTLQTIGGAHSYIWLQVAFHGIDQPELVPAVHLSENAVSPATNVPGRKFGSIVFGSSAPVERVPSPIANTLPGGVVGGYEGSSDEYALDN